MSESPPEENDQTSEKSLVIFGRDVSKIPCFRSSFLYGTLGGLGFGLAHFMFTSKAFKSVNYSVYAFSMITMGYWMRCRYEYSKTKFEMLRLQEAMKAQMYSEGIEPDANPPPPLEVIDI